MRVFFAADLHGDPHRYAALFRAVREEAPGLVCLGGDLLPHLGTEPFIEGVLVRGFDAIRSELRDDAPAVCLTFGNDDPRACEPELLRWEEEGLWSCLNGRPAEVGGHVVLGYPWVPPTPFQLKDWERYDVAHYVDPGCISPEEGMRTVEVDPMEPRYATIERDLARLTDGADLSRTLCLFHSPPYRTSLDRAALDGRTYDHAPLDVHVGSIAIRRFIESRQPLVTMHGHVHESVRLTGRFLDRIGRTTLLGAAHDGPELALVRFDTDQPEAATRELV